MFLSRLQPIRGLAVIGLAALCGCRPVPPIKVGFVGGLSGRVSELAVDGRNGAQLAIETLNSRNGARYELRVHDDGQVDAQGPAAIDAAADEGDAFAVGPMTSVLAQGMMQAASRRHLVLISPTANADELSGIDDYFFRVAPSAGAGADQFADAAIARGLTAASVMMEWRSRSYTENFAKRFSTRFVALGGTPAQLIRYETEQNPDYGKVASALLATHPKFVLLVCSAVDAAIVAQQLRRLDPDVKLAMASWAANLQLVQLGGRAVEGALVLQALDLESQEPAYVDFRRRFVARFGNPPSQAAVFSYDATMMGAEGLRRKTSRQSLRDALRAPGAWPALQQPLTLDHFGDSVGRFHLSEVRNGHFVMLPS
jgi:branched-chain amino acid transport system substrate-binding protein